MPGGEAVTALNYQGNITIPTQSSGEGTTTAPAGGTTVATANTPATPAPGLYTAAWEVWLESGTPGTSDANNFGLYVNSVLQAQSINPATVTAQPAPQGAVQINVPVSGTVTVKAINASNGTTVVYAAQLSLVPVAVVSPDDPLYPYNPLTVNGQNLTVTSTPSNITVVAAGYDLSEQAECVVGRGSLVPSGTSNFGFVDTTYAVTQAQMLTAPFGQPGSGQYAY
jgi:hypothetical protein